jgi:hypothetical protein
MQRLYCHAPDCALRARWFIGSEFRRGAGDFSRGHAACDKHLADGCLVTLRQLLVEGETDARLDVRPIQSVEAIT